MDITKITSLLKEKKVFSTVNFIILYGSHGTQKQSPLSDIDIAISFNLPKQTRNKMRLYLLSHLPSSFDIKIFEDVPLRIKHEIFGGKLLYCRDINEAVLLAQRVKKEHEDFLPRYHYYISGIKHGKQAYL